MYTITLPSGKVFSGLTLNGNNFVSSEKVTEEDFAQLPGAVVIEAEGTEHTCLEGEHECMELVQVKKYPDGYYFILRDIEATELGRVEAKLDYVAMMMGVEV